MTLWVTGGAGFIGSAVVQVALADSRAVLNVDSLTYAGQSHARPSVEGHPKYQFSKTDICDREALMALAATTPPSAILHLAAESHVDRSIDGPAAFMQTNIIGTFNLLEVARAHNKDGFKFVHVSTDEVYGDLGASDPAFTETTPYAPSSPYAASKAASDHLVRAWGRTYDLPVLITNCSNNYGPYQYPEKLIPVIILKALSGQNIPIYGKGDQIRDWLYVEDHARALLTVLGSGKTGETYNIGGNNEMTNLDLATRICQILDEKRPKTSGRYADQITHVTDRPGHDRRYAINASKIANDLGWTPSVTDGFSDTVQWYLDNADWWKPLAEQGAAARRGLSG